MKNSSLGEVIIRILMVVSLAVTCCLIGRNVGRNVGRNAGYKEACIDFYKGKLKYELVTNLDGTREWKKIEKQEK